MCQSVRLTTTKATWRDVAILLCHLLFDLFVARPQPTVSIFRLNETAHFNCFQCNKNKMCTIDSSFHRWCVEPDVPECDWANTLWCFGRRTYGWPLIRNALDEWNMMLKARIDVIRANFIIEKTKNCFFLFLSNWTLKPRRWFQSYRSFQVRSELMKGEAKPAFREESEMRFLWFDLVLVVLHTKHSEKMTFVRKRMEIVVTSNRVQVKYKRQH